MRKIFSFHNEIIALISSIRIDIYNISNYSFALDCTNEIFSSTLHLAALQIWWLFCTCLEKNFRKLIWSQNMHGDK